MIEAVQKRFANDDGTVACSPLAAAASDPNRVLPVVFAPINAAPWKTTSSTTPSPKPKAKWNEHATAAKERARKVVAEAEAKWNEYTTAAKEKARKIVNAAAAKTALSKAAAAKELAQKRETTRKHAKTEAREKDKIENMQNENAGKKKKLFASKKEASQKKAEAARTSRPKKPKVSTGIPARIKNCPGTCPGSSGPSLESIRNQFGDAEKDVRLEIPIWVH